VKLRTVERFLLRRGERLAVEVQRLEPLVADGVVLIDGEEAFGVDGADLEAVAVEVVVGRVAVGVRVAHHVADAVVRLPASSGARCPSTGR
jgi:hypothetical protein